MDKKVLFLDFDGTLATFHEEVPDSARRAVARARANGHRVVLSTGRTPYEMKRLGMDMELDGMICASGAYVSLGDEIVCDEYAPRDSVVYATEYMRSHGIDYFWEGREGAFGSPGVTAKMRSMLIGNVTDEQYADIIRNVVIMRIIQEPEASYPEHIYKAVFLQLEGLTIGQLRSDMAGRFDLLHCTVPKLGLDSGELILPGFAKEDAVKLALERWNAPVADSIAFGDSSNDVGALKFCGVGVAMGNAAPNIRAVADMVTDDVEEDGLYNAFVRLGLI